MDMLERMGVVARRKALANSLAVIAQVVAERFEGVYVGGREGMFYAGSAGAFWKRAVGV